MCKIKKTCLTCNKEFEVSPSKEHQKYCSRKCMGENMSGENSPHFGSKIKKYKCVGENMSGENSPHLGSEIKKYECVECDTSTSNIKIIWAPIFGNLGRVKVYSCFDCVDVINQRILDDIKNTSNVSKIEDDAYNVGYDRGYDRGYEDGIHIMNEQLNSENDAIFISGVEEGIELSKVCPRCKSHYGESIHHIIPRKFGGKDNISNLIILCFQCHDYVEIETEKLFNNNKLYSMDTLRSFIINGFPNMM